jgi:imidazolonepropionase-like amidohydrolase
MLKITSFLICSYLFMQVTALAATTAFVNVNVLPMDEPLVLAGQTVVVDGDKIATIGDVQNTILPDDAVVVDGTDRYLLPGLAEMHGHVPGVDAASLQRVMHLYAANGITLVRGMLGHPMHLALRLELLEGDVIGPRLITAGPSFNGRSVTSAAQARQMVREQHAAGYDFLKIHPGLTREEFDAVAESARELGIPFAGHVPEDVGVRRALAAGIASIDHLDGYMEALMPANRDASGGFGGFFGVFLAGQADASKIRSIVAATAAAGVWNVPTETLFENVSSATDPDLMVDWPEMKYMPVETIARWRQYKIDLMGDPQYDAVIADRAIALRRKLIVALQDQDAGLLLGSDSPQIFNVPGFAIHRELELLVAAGLSAFEALQTGTVNPARFFAREDSSGMVKAGFDADLVLLDDNPLDDIRNSRRIQGVMLRGQWLSRQDLDRLLTPLKR